MLRLVVVGEWDSLGRWDFWDFWDGLDCEIVVVEFVLVDFSSVKFKGIDLKAVGQPCTAVSV